MRRLQQLQRRQAGVAVWPPLPSAAPPVVWDTADDENAACPGTWMTVPEPEGLPLFILPQGVLDLPLDDPRNVAPDFNPQDEDPAAPHLIPGDFTKSYMNSINKKYGPPWNPIPQWAPK